MNNKEKLMDLAVAGTGNVPAGEEGISPTLVGMQANGRRKFRLWTGEEEDYLRRKVHELGIKGVAKELGRSSQAIKIRANRMRIKLRSKKYLSANQVAIALGTDVHAVVDWQRKGLIELQRAPMPERKTWRIERKKLIVWAVNPRNWPYYLYTLHNKIRKIRDPKIRQLVELRRERWGDEWLTTREVGVLFGADHADAHRVFVENEKYRGDKVQWGANWRLRRSHVLESGIKIWKLGKGAGDLGEWSARGQQFMLQAFGLGLAERDVAILMGRPQIKTLGYRIKVLQRRGELTELARAGGVQVRMEGEEILLFADWAEHVERFPFIAQAVGDFLAKRKYTWKTDRLVRRTLFTWAQWYADSPAKRGYARKLRWSQKWLTAKTNWRRYKELLSWGIDPLHGQNG